MPEIRIRYDDGYWRRCRHRSHRLRLPCWRGHTYDGQCGKHNTTCYHDCPTRKETR